MILSRFWGERYNELSLHFCSIVNCRRSVQTYSWPLFNKVSTHRRVLETRISPQLHPGAVGVAGVTAARPAREELGFGAGGARMEICVKALVSKSSTAIPTPLALKDVSTINVLRYIQYTEDKVAKIYSL